MVPVCDKRYHIYNRFRHFGAEIKKLWNYPYFNKAVSNIRITPNRVSAFSAVSARVVKGVGTFVLIRAVPILIWDRSVSLATGLNHIYFIMAIVTICTIYTINQQRIFPPTSARFSALAMQFYIIY